ncbi:hypothetical protein EV426DRAFT_703843 [Tirmania nivea]|nr:hypothetical protein EV426DRAFT_703843 [Tirmania nivea]
MGTMERWVFKETFLQLTSLLQGKAACAEINLDWAAVKQLVVKDVGDEVEEDAEDAEMDVAAEEEDLINSITTFENAHFATLHFERVTSHWPEPWEQQLRTKGAKATKEERREPDVKAEKGEPKTEAERPNTTTFDLKRHFDIWPPGLQVLEHCMNEIKRKIQVW